MYWTCCVLDLLWFCGFGEGQFYVSAFACHTTGVDAVQRLEKKSFESPSASLVFVPLRCVSVPLLLFNFMLYSLRLRKSAAAPFSSLVCGFLVLILVGFCLDEDCNPGKVNCSPLRRLLFLFCFKRCTASSPVA